MTGHGYLRRAGIMLWHVRIRLLSAVAALWRRLLFRTTFVAITGSVGKTTAKECLAAALASRFPTAKTYANENGYGGVPRSVLRVRPWHRFAVIEIGTSQNGQIRRAARVVSPEVAVILAVARTHTNNFRTLDNIAAEKAQLLRALRPGGVAVLNGDDPRVAAMANPSKHRVVWFGSSPSFDYQVESASSRWPERLSLQVRAGGESHKVQSRLVGTHWRNSVLAALAAAGVCGVTAADAGEAISTVEPTPGRMQPALLPSGATMLRDEYNGSADTLPHALQALAEASASRKILVISDISDSSQKPRERLARIGREAARIADSVVFVGDRAAYGAGGAMKAGMAPEKAHTFASLEEASVFLVTELTEGDLVLLRGRATDHLSRLYHAQLGTVKCRKARCELTILCDLCPQLGAKPYGPSQQKPLIPMRQA